VGTVRRTLFTVLRHAKISNTPRHLLRIHGIDLRSPKVEVTKRKVQQQQQEEEEEEEEEIEKHGIDKDLRRLRLLVHHEVYYCYEPPEAVDRRFQVRRLRKGFASSRPYEPYGEEDIVTLSSSLGVELVSME
jgi:hypothetical protein